MKKTVQIFRLAPTAFEILIKISNATGENKTQVIERALYELLRNHPEYWPPERNDKPA